VVPQLERGQIIKHPYLGVQTAADPVNPNGAQVQTVVPGGPAEKAGLRPGDLIKSLDGQPVRDPSDLSSAIDVKKPGDKVTLQIERNGLTQEIDATLGTRPKNP